MTRRKWEKHEVEMLIQFANNSKGRTVKEIAIQLKRTKNSVEKKLFRLRESDFSIPYLNEWSDDEIDYLIAFSNNPEGDSIEDVAVFLGRERNQVSYKLKLLRKESDYISYLEKKWSEREIEILKQTYHRRTYREIADQLGRTEAAISLKVQKLGLSKESHTHPNTLKKLDKEIRMLAKQGFTRNEIAEKTGLGYKVIKNYLLRNEIKCEYEAPKVTERQKEIMRNTMRHAFRRY